MALILYFMGTPARKRALRAQEAAERAAAIAAHAQPLQSRQMQAAMRPLTRSRRWEKNRDGLPTVHHAGLLSLP